MAKTRTKYVCESCGRESPRYMGRCPGCGEFNTMNEVVEVPPGKGGPARPSAAALQSHPQKLRDVSTEAGLRLPLPIDEFARVLGGGIVPGSVILIGGDPGVGKSTLLLQAAALLADRSGPVLYVSGEESARQIKMRADRLDLNPDDLYLVTETNLGAIFEHVAKLEPQVLVVDSIQTTFMEELTSTAGSITQVRECANRLRELAKSSGIAVFLVGHVTKEGNIAGPRVLEHIVDTVLYLEGDPFQVYRLLRSVKNRFGATSEVGVFEMRGSGLVEVANPSEAFLAERVVNAPGSAIAVTLEGTRPLLVEVQALCSPTSFGYARRTANGVDYNRLLLIAAVLTRRLGFKLSEQDIFVNVIGGLKIDEPAADLAVAIALASSYLDRPVPADLAIVGEIGLSGELRAVSQFPVRLNEAGKLGFKRVLIPRPRRKDDLQVKGVEVIPVRNIAEALRVAVPEK
ncbi:MAG: DNA repair protein RadA [Anaerolineae bacterium]|nr:DNA repair protein RadA [Anaerolineae bacterium]